MDLVCRLSSVGDLPVLHVVGEIDLGTVPVLHDHLTRIVGDHPGATVCIDLDGVSALDDAGLGLLLGAAASAREHDGDLVLVCTSPRLLRRFELTGVSRAVTVRSTVRA